MSRKTRYIITALAQVAFWTAAFTAARYALKASMPPEPPPRAECYLESYDGASYFGCNGERLCDLADKRCMALGIAGGYDFMSLDAVKELVKGVVREEEGEP
jgi:hypothetical protein